MKKMPKNLFDELIKTSCKWWREGSRITLFEKGEISRRIEDVTGIDYLCVEDLVDSIIRSRGFLPGADNKKFYEVLRVLGWEVVEDV